MRYKYAIGFDIMSLMKNQEREVLKGKAVPKNLSKIFESAADEQILSNNYSIDEEALIAALSDLYTGELDEDSVRLLWGESADYILAVYSHLDTQIRSFQTGTKTLAEAQIYFKLHELFSKTATEYRLMYNKEERADYSQEVSIDKKTVEAALAELYFLGEDTEELSEYNLNWGESAASMRQLLSVLQEKIAALKNSVYEETANYNSLQKLWAGQLITRRFYRLTPEQKKQFLEVSGYSSNSTEIMHSLESSFKLQVATTIPAVGISYTAALAGGLTSVINEIPDELKGYVTPVSVVGVYTAIFVAATQYTRMLKNENIQACPNLPQTFLYYLSKRVFPDDEQMQTYMATLGMPLQSALADLIWSTASTAHESINSAFVAKNIANIAIFLTSAVVAYLYSKNKA